MTDNRNRTASELRRLFESAGGNLGASGCVGYLFNFKGLFVVDSEHVSEERLMEVALEAGADDVQLVDGYFEVTSDPKLFEAVRKSLEDQKIALETPRLRTSRPTTWTSTSRTAARCASSKICSMAMTTYKTFTPMTTFLPRRWRRERSDAAIAMQKYQ